MFGLENGNCEKNVKEKIINAVVHGNGFCYTFSCSFYVTM